MDVVSLRIFVEVMQRGSFAAVARVRDVAPSSISRSIAALEEELGIRLFQRSTRRLQPTEAGMMYFEHIEPVVEELDRAQAMITDAGEEPKGLLRITAPMSFGQLALVPALPEFLETYPQVSVEILMTNAIVDLLAERIDLAIRLGPLADSSYIANRLCPMNYIICASPAYLQKHGEPRVPADIQEHECLLFPLPGYGALWRFKDAQGEISEIKAQGRCQISNGMALKECAVAGLGLVMQPRWNVAQDLRNGSLVELFPDHEVTATDFNISAWLLYPTRSYLPLKTRTFVDFFKHRFHKSPGPGEA